MKEIGRDFKRTPETEKRAANSEQQADVSQRQEGETSSPPRGHLETLVFCVCWCSVQTPRNCWESVGDKCAVSAVLYCFQICGAKGVLARKPYQCCSGRAFCVMLVSGTVLSRTAGRSQCLMSVSRVSSGSEEVQAEFDMIFSYWTGQARGSSS